MSFGSISSKSSQIWRCPECGAVVEFIAKHKTKPERSWKSCNRRRNGEASNGVPQSAETSGEAGPGKEKDVTSTKNSIAGESAESTKPQGQRSEGQPKRSSREDPSEPAISSGMAAVFARHGGGPGSVNERMRRVEERSGDEQDMPRLLPRPCFTLDGGTRMTGTTAAPCPVRKLLSRQLCSNIAAKLPRSLRRDQSNSETVNLWQHENPQPYDVSFRFHTSKLVVVNKPFFRRCKPRVEQDNSMWHGSTKTLLESIVRQLRTEAPHDDGERQAHTDLVQTCLTEMTEMSKPIVLPLMASRYIHRPLADKLNRAVPYLRSMLTAMQEHDRTAALAHGETTLQRL